MLLIYPRPGDLKRKTWDMTEMWSNYLGTQMFTLCVSNFTR